MAGRRNDLPFTSLSKLPLEKWIRKYNTTVIVEPKYDGEDILIVVPENQPKYAVNRYGTVYTLDSLPTLNELHNWPTGTIARAEMHIPGGSVYDLRSAIARNPHTIYLAVHDLIMDKGANVSLLPLSDRKSMLYTIECREGGQVFMVKSLGETDNTTQIREWFNQAVMAGFEGVVVKPLNSPYKSDNCLKLKKTVSHDVLLTAIKTENMKNGVPWCWKMEGYVNGQLVDLGDVSSAVKEVERTEVMRPIVREDKTYQYFDEPIVGEVRGQNLTENYKFRHPVLMRIRKDKPAIECEITVK